ncbi:MAG: SpoIIE family protein phosphatase [Victivallaceae bacterium]|nr:SpoIIE family protein phosphatase [Victivallaceae bacterium]
MATSTDKPAVTLIVDNDPVSQRLFRAICGEGEYELVFCETSQEAMRIMRSRQVDLLISEVILPDENGFELRKKVRLQTPELPIIFVSAVIDSGSRKLLENISNDVNTYFLRKPVYKADLLSLTRQIIAAARERNLHRVYFDQLQNDLSLASKMQKLMLPDWLCLYDHSIYMMANYMPHSHLSGDYFDMTMLPDGRLFFVIGDISGHGIRAALHMSVIQSVTNYFIRGAKTGNIVCDYLNLINRQICETFESVFYLTCLVAIFDPARRQVEYMSAGHPGFLVFDRKSGVMRCLEQPRAGVNIPVGWMPDFVYKHEDLHHAEFTPDDTFLAITDGVMERTDHDGHMLGLDGICRLCRHDDNAGLLPFLLDDRMAAAGFNDVQDDMLMLAIGYAEEGDQTDKSTLVRTIPQKMSDAVVLSQDVAAMVEKRTGDGKLAYKVELVMGEFLNNIVVHGFDNAQRNTPCILVETIVTAEKIEMIFYDMGKEWNYVPKNRSFLDEVEDDFFILAQAGRGMGIIEEIVQSISRRRVGNALNITVITMDVKSDDSDHAVK